MGSNLNKQLNKIIASKVKFKDGLTLEQKLKIEVDRLYDCIQDKIDEYYDSYEPKVYRRTYRFQDSMYAQDIVDIRVLENKITLSINFHPSLANHPSLFGGEDGYVPLLLNYGWVAEKLEDSLGYIIPRFTRFEGIHFIEEGIKEYNRINPLGITVNINKIANGNPSVISFR